MIVWLAFVAGLLIGYLFHKLGADQSPHHDNSWQFKNVKHYLR